MTDPGEGSENTSASQPSGSTSTEPLKKKKKSLRRLFFTRTVLFTLVPLTILAVVVQNQYKSTINKQIKDRLTVHVREIEALFSKQRNEIENFLSFTTGDKSLTFYLSSLDVGQVRTALAEKISRFTVQQVKVYTYSGQPFLYYDGAFKSIEGQGVLPREIIEALESRNDLNRVRFWKTGSDTLLMLSEVRRIRGYQGKTVGYLEAFLPVGKDYVEDLKKSTGAEIVFFNRQGEVLLGSIPNPEESEMLSREFLLGHNTFIEFDLNSEPFAFISAKLSWGSKKFLLGVGSSTSEAERSLRRVNYVIVFTYVCFLVFFLLMSYFFVTEFIHPIEALIKASEQMKISRDVVHIESESQTEIAELIDSFNDMSKLIYDSDFKMKNQLDLLEKANTKIQKTQGQLVQSAKLASLGELVAGIAHELNNPIGFIYSNVEHLKQYSQDLIAVAEIANSKVALTKKEDIDFEYIKKDFPKLIQSCEEGAVRAKEIVIGLRNFSRVDDEQVQQFDVNAGLESTLKLLGGELKNRIEVVTQLGELPLIRCNSNQIKQVFMNILSNAAQAIDGKGRIAITTSALETGDAVGISVADSGPGISKENLEKIFDPFFTTKEVGKGTGLGLSISYGIITSHGGQIEVSSEEGKGTEFRIALPVVGVKALRQS